MLAWKLFLLEAFSLLFKVPDDVPSLQSKSSYENETPLKFHNFSSLFHSAGEFSSKTLIFQMEAALLKSSSLFPYFMLVAFEAGGLFRALILFLSYPFVWLIGEEMGLKIMVFICFFGIKKKKFKIGTSVLPKFFLEDVGCEGFDVVIRYGRKIGVTNLPRVMVEGFLKDYLGVEAVVGRDLKVISGYFVGLMEEKNADDVLNEILREENLPGQAIGIGCWFNKRSYSEQLFSLCKEVYLVDEEEKKKWQILPKEKYIKPLIFHDGRLAFRPTLFASTLALFMWIPFGILLATIRMSTAILMPQRFHPLIYAFSGNITTVSKTKSSITSTKSEEKSRGVLYVCNHRTLIDPIAVAFATRKPLTAVTYSLSKMSEIISPIRTVKLTRDRVQDRKTMYQMLNQGDLVVCPEGTTCREPYLLRFSPLFAELTDEIIPVALDLKVSMFYGSTASGLKFLDPIIHNMNPNPVYTINFLEKLPQSHTCKAGGKSRFEVANHVQSKIGAALGFTCTTLTRKDKYLLLAGNDGITKDSKCF